MSAFKNTLTETPDKQDVIDHLLGYLNENQQAEGKGQGIMHNLGYLDEDQFVDAAKYFADNKFHSEALLDIAQQFDDRYNTNFVGAIKSIGQDEE